MNLAVHGLEGDIQKAITYYEDPHELVGKADFVMANPPDVFVRIAADDCPGGICMLLGVGKLLVVERNDILNKRLRGVLNSSLVEPDIPNGPIPNCLLERIAE